MATVAELTFALQKIIDDEIHKFDIGMGPDVNLLDALAEYRREDNIGPANELMSLLAMHCAEAIVSKLNLSQ
jgi:hypothetical protein